MHGLEFPTDKFCGQCQCWRNPKGGKNIIQSNGHRQRWMCAQCCEAVNLRKAKSKALNGEY